MKYKSFDLEITKNGEFDISFSPLKKKKIIKKKIIKKKKTPEKDLLTISEDDDEEEDLSRFISVDGIEYVQFPEDDAAYDKGTLRYVGKWSENFKEIHFTERGLNIHKNLKLT